MGIFKTTHEVTPEEKQFQADNLKRLKNEFDMTKAMGIKKYPDAMQFIYDKDHRCFVVVQEPEETLKLKNPYIVDFDQVKDVFLEVEEYWSETQEKHNHSQGVGQGVLNADRFDEVFWRYNLVLNIITSHPYAKTISYRMNYNEIITKVSGNGITFPPRGLELNGRLSGEELKQASERIAEFAQKQKKAVGTKKKVDILTGNRPDGILNKMAKDVFEEKYVNRMENVSKHLDRAYRISKVLGKA